MDLTTPNYSRRLDDHHACRSFKDSDITWLMQVYRDFELGWWALGCLRKHYPQSRVIVVSDGDDDPRWSEVCRELSCEFVLQDRIYGMEHGTKLWTKRFEYFAKAPTKYLFKIDTDTAVHRRFHYLPNFMVFSTVLFWPGAVNDGRASGGFIGIRQDAIQLIVESGQLQNFPQHEVPKWERSDSQELISEDWLLSAICKKLEIPIRDFPEVCVLAREKPFNRDLLYAITHPNKHMKL